MQTCRSQHAGVPFDSLYAHGFFRVAVGTPEVAVARPQDNLRHTLALARRAAEQHAGLVLFPELGLSAYSNEDLFFQDALLDAVAQALHDLVVASRDLPSILIVGAPLRIDAKLFNCAAIVYRGRVLGIVPKSYLPNYREFYEKRQFASAADAGRATVLIQGQEIPFGSGLVFEALGVPGLAFHVEICEDVWVPVPPSTYGALAGATILANLSASNATIGKADYRRLLCAAQSGKCVAAYLYAAAGPGESTTDLAWDGQCLIYENSELLAESPRFPPAGQLVTADLDLDRLVQERVRLTSFTECATQQSDALARVRRVGFDFAIPGTAVPLQRDIPRFPYVPADPRSRDERCADAYNIQTQGLMQRLRATGIRTVVIGISGGLDSTQAAIVAAKAFDRLELPRTNILGYTLPGLATSKKTYDNAWRLMRALKISASEIDIRPSVEQMLRDLDHPYSRGEPVYDTTFENVQAGERTSHLFRLANRHGALVIGTGDLSELALGYTTYGVGDHMSHYNVNASVPKTLIQHLIRWVAKSGQFDAEASALLMAIVATAISPELIPGRGTRPEQLAEDTIGPYELQDFHLYYLSRYGYRPSKVAFLAHHAWSDRRCGAWPDTVPAERRQQYDLPTIKKWLAVFLTRFFETSQFKRSAMPNGPKVGSGGSLSPRSDWRAPSDACAAAWLQELAQNVP